MKHISTHSIRSTFTCANQTPIPCISRTPCYIITCITYCSSWIQVNYKINKTKIKQKCRSFVVKKKSNIPILDVYGTRMFDSAVCSNVWYIFVEKKTLTFSFLFPFYWDGLCLLKWWLDLFFWFLRIIFPFFVVSTLIFAFILIFLTHVKIFMSSGYINFHSIRPPRDIFVTFIEPYSLTCDRV